MKKQTPKTAHEKQIAKIIASLGRRPLSTRLQFMGATIKTPKSR